MASADQTPRVHFPPLPPAPLICPECGQTGQGEFCHHWDAAGERKIRTVKWEDTDA